MWLRAKTDSLPSTCLLNAIQIDPVTRTLDLPVGTAHIVQPSIRGEVAPVARGPHAAGNEVTLTLQQTHPVATTCKIGESGEERRQCTLVAGLAWFSFSVYREALRVTCLWVQYENILAFINNMKTSWLSLLHFVYMCTTNCHSNLILFHSSPSSSWV